MTILQFMSDSPVLTAVIVVLTYFFVDGLISRIENVAIAFAPKRCCCDDESDEESPETSANIGAEAKS